jgi:choline transport protein
MNGSKDISDFHVSNLDFDNGEELIQKQKGGTPADARHMHRMGKRQELQRNFRFITIVGFIMILQFSWESVLM